MDRTVRLSVLDHSEEEGPCTLLINDGSSVSSEASGSRLVLFAIDPDTRIDRWKSIGSFCVLRRARVCARGAARGEYSATTAMGAACVDAAGWINAFSLDCAAYEDRGWCKSGVVLNRSATGTVFHRPEASCCACGRLPPRPSATSQIVFVAAHSVGGAVPTMVSRLAREIDQLPLTKVQPWLLLFTGSRGTLPDVATLDRWRSIDAHVCPWSLSQIYGLFPKMETALGRSRAAFFAPADYLRHYFIFHSSLALWLRLFGDGYPKLSHVWRVEPDVQLVGYGGWSALLSGTSRLSTDVLLPKLTLEADSDADYAEHWHINRDFTKNVPPAQRAWSLVSIGRYSLTFIREVMWPQWARGVLAYEEIFLPTSCLAYSAGNCSVGDFGTLVDARRVRYRPEWECAPFLRAAQSRGGLQLWHPVKDAECISRALSLEDQKVSYDAARELVPLALPPPSPPSVPSARDDEPEARRSFVFREPARDPLVRHANVLHKHSPHG